MYHPKTHSRMHLPPTRERMLLLWNNSLVVDQLWVLKIGRDHVAVVERVTSCKHRLLPVYLPFYYYWMNEELIATYRDELDGVLVESEEMDPLVNHLMEVDEYYYGGLVLPGGGLVLPGKMPRLWHIRLWNNMDGEL